MASKCVCLSILFTLKKILNVSFWLFVFADDLIFTRNRLNLCEEFKKAMMHEFEMTNIGFLHFFFGIKVKKNEDRVFITQKKYAKDLLKMFRMEGAKPISTPVEVGLKLSNSNAQIRLDGTLYRSFVGSLMYLTATRPDIMFTVNMLSRIHGIS